jgi:hypothetical protein
MRDRHMRHGGEHPDARHQRAAKPEPAHDRVVVDFVLGRGERLAARTEWVGRG